MKLRADSKILSQLVANKLITLPEAKAMSALALMDVPIPQISPDFERWVKNSPKYTENYHLDFEKFPFYEMVFFLDNGLKEKKIDKNRLDGHRFFYCKLKLINENKVELSFTDNPKYWIVTEITYVDESRFTTDIVDVLIDKSIKAVNLSEVTEELIQLHFYKKTSNTPYMAMSILLWFAEFNNQKDNYLVSVSKNRKPKLPHNCEGEIAKVAGPRIIYLDKLPTHSDEGSINLNESRTVAAHQRRGTYVTLRAERYRNHPLYQIEKAIYRKPAWVGDRSTIVNGATYTVIDKENNFGD